MTQHTNPKTEKLGESVLSSVSVVVRTADTSNIAAMSNTKMYTSVSQRMASTYNRVSVDSRVETASPHELISMLFDGLLSSLSATKIHIECGNVAAKSQSITKSMRIISEGLKSSLDPQGGDLSANLGMLYDYCVAQLMQAHLKNDVTLIDEVVGLIEPIADSWKNMNNATSQ